MQKLDSSYPAAFGYPDPQPLTGTNSSLVLAVLGGIQSAIDSQELVQLKIIVHLRALVQLAQNPEQAAQFLRQL
jgi:hypothetical protein